MVLREEKIIKLEGNQLAGFNGSLTETKENLDGTDASHY